MPPETTPSKCNCFFLHEAATDPNSPIVFDTELNEFHTKTLNGYSMIYYCPICGGPVPKSLRDDLFAKISSEEEERLNSMTDKIKSLEELIAAYGEPDRQQNHYSYKHLSDTANVVAITENGEWRGIHFSRKQIKIIEKNTEENDSNT